MSCYVAAPPFQAHANYGTWSIDFERNPSSQQQKDYLLENRLAFLKKP